MIKAEIANQFSSDIQDYLFRYLPRTSQTKVFEIEPCQESLDVFSELLEKEEIKSYEGVTIINERYHMFQGSRAGQKLNLTLITPFHNMREWINFYLEKGKRFDVTLINKSIVRTDELEDYKEMIKKRNIYFFEYYSDSPNIEKRI